MSLRRRQTKLPEFYFSFIVLWLRLAGIEVSKKEESAIYRFYSASIFLLTLAYVVVEYIEIKFHGDFDTITIILFCAVFQTFTVAKAVVIYRNRKAIGLLMKSFHEGFYKPNKNRLGEFEEECVTNTLNQSRSQTIPYGAFFSSAIVVGLIQSLISRLTQKPENWILPYVPNSLVDTTRSPAFELVWACQGVTSCICCTWTFLCDCTVISIIALTVAQLKILERCIRNYNHRGIQMLPGEEKSVSENLHDTVKFHLTILDTVNTVEELCSYLVLSVFLADLILLCVAMYDASMSPLFSAEFVKYFIYCLGILLQIFIYCWWGNEMSISNEALSSGIFETYHPYDPLAYSKVLKLMLGQAQKPLFFTAGKFVPLSLETFKAIVKGSFSYFTVLRQLNLK